MNKWQIICPVVAMLLVLLVASALVGGHAQHKRRVLVSAVTQQVDAHVSQIRVLLTNMRGSNVTLVEDAAFQELQAIPSTSLISRSMVKVAPAADGRLECVIDTRPLGIPFRTIRSSQ